MTLVLVEGMPDTPGVCALCAGNPIDEITNEQQQAIFAEGVDIDWGNSLYICLSCAHIIANLIDRATQEGFDKLQDKYEKLYLEHEELQTEHDEMKEVVATIRAGAAASKKLREKTTA